MWNVECGGFKTAASTFNLQHSTFNNHEKRRHKSLNHESPANGGALGDLDVLFVKMVKYSQI